MDDDSAQLLAYQLQLEEELMELIELGVEYRVVALGDKTERIVKSISDILVLIQEIPNILGEKNV